MRDIVYGILAWFWLAALFILFAAYNICKLALLAFKRTLKWLAEQRRPRINYGDK